MRTSLMLAVVASLALPAAARPQPADEPFPPELGQAQFNGLVPACANPEPWCDSGDLLVGRGQVGPELNAPNTLPDRTWCPDGDMGFFHESSSIDRIRVSPVDGCEFVAGKDALVEVTLWSVGGFEAVDLYFTADATGGFDVYPVWQYVGTLQPQSPPAFFPPTGPVVLATTYTIPEGHMLQAVRAHLRTPWETQPGECTFGMGDRDDLVFWVAMPYLQ